MGMGENDCGWRDLGEGLEPIGAAIDHDAGAATPDQKRAMPAVAARSCLDLAARTEKGELDLSLPMVLEGSRRALTNAAASLTDVNSTLGGSILRQGQRTPGRL
jgi:hypothetical protein